MSEKDREQTTKEILDLIRLIDKNKDNKGKALFRKEDIFNGSLSIIVGLFIIELSVYITYALGKISLIDYIALTFALLAVLIAFLSLMAEFFENTILDVRFKRALGLKPSFSKNEKLILKALIKVKSKHEEFSLEDVYEKNMDMFTKEKLIEKLYD